MGEAMLVLGAENIWGIHVSWLKIAVNLKLLPKSLRRRNMHSQFRKLGKIDGVDYSEYADTLEALIYEN